MTPKQNRYRNTIKIQLKPITTPPITIEKKVAKTVWNNP
jgi:hypothetical protein